jgi:molecular chaperone DnaK (HSP70)
MNVIIPRNTPIPCQDKKHTFSTASDNQTVATFRVLEGEDQRASECYLLDKFELTGIAPAQAGTPKLECTFNYD